jgi:type II secretory pathway pseudopilin PulG
MIVVGIIAIIAAIAIPNLLRSRMSANEASASGSMRTISSGQVAFQTAAFVDSDGDGHGDYGTLAQLADPDGGGATPPFVDAILGGGTKEGYVYTVAVTLGSAAATPAYNCTAVPSSSGQTGFRQFYVDETGVIRFTLLRLP